MTSDLFGAPTLRVEEKAGEGGPELHVRLQLPKPSAQLTKQCKMDFHLKAFEGVQEKESNELSISLCAGPPARLQLRNEHNLKALFEGSNMQSVDLYKGLQTPVELQLLAAADEPCVFAESKVPWAELRTANDVRIQRLPFNASGVCILPAGSTEKPIPLSTDGSLKYGERMALKIVVTDALENRLTVPGGTTHIYKTLPKVTIVKRFFCLDRVAVREATVCRVAHVSGEELKNDIFFGDSLSLIFKAVSDSAVGSHDFAKIDKAFRDNVTMRLTVAYRSEELGGLVAGCGDSQFECNKGKVEVKVTMPDKIGQDYLDECYVLDVVLTGDMIQPERNDAHKTVVKLRVQPKASAPAALRVLAIDPPLLDVLPSLGQDLQTPTSSEEKTIPPVGGGADSPINTGVEGPRSLRRGRGGM